MTDLITPLRDSIAIVQENKRLKRLVLAQQEVIARLKDQIADRTDFDLSADTPALLKKQV